MRILEIPGLPKNARHIHRVQMAASEAGGTLGLLVGDAQVVRSAHWLSLPNGKEILRRDLPVFEGAPIPAMSADLRVLAYQQPGSGGLELVVERPLETPPQRRGIGMGPLPALALSPDGKNLMTTAPEGVTGYSVDKFFTAPPPNEDEGFSARFLYISDGGCDGKQMQVAPSSLTVMSNADGSCSMVFGSDWGGWVDSPRPTGSVTALGFSLDSRLLGVAHGKRVAVWNMIDEEEDIDECSVRFKLPAQTDVVHGVAFGPDGKKLATACADGTVSLWAVTEKKKAHCLSTLDGKVGPLGAVAFAPDGNQYAVGTFDGRIVLWDNE